MVAKTESALSRSLLTMYLPLPYVPHRIFQCPTSGYTAVTKNACDTFVKEYDQWGDRVFYDDDAAVEVYDTQLTMVERCPFDSDAEVHGITSVVVSLDDGVEYSDNIMTIIHADDRVLAHCSTDIDHVFAPSTVPYQTIVVEIIDTQHTDETSSDDKPPPMLSTLYRVPTELTDFIKLPRVLAHKHKMIVCIHALSHHLHILDVIAVIIVASTQAHRILDYAQYCEGRSYHSVDDWSQSDDR